MKRLTIVVGAMFVLLSQFSTLAAITPVIFRVASDSTNYLETYTVPLDKILVVDACHGRMPYLILTNGLKAPLSVSSAMSDRGIKVPGGTLIRCDIASEGFEYEAHVFGLLVDMSDLYAQFQPSIHDIAPVFGEGMVSLTAYGGNDAIIRIEQSGDISTGQWSPVATFATGIAPERTIALADENSPHNFYRLRTLSH